MIYLLWVLTGLVVAPILNEIDFSPLWGGAIGAVFAYFHTRFIGVEAKLKDHEEFKNAVLTEVLQLRDQIRGTQAPPPAPRESVADFIQRPQPQVSVEVQPQPETPQAPVQRPATSPEIPRPTIPPTPSAFDQALKLVVQYFSTGNTIAKIGMVILFIGVGFLVKYTSDRGILPIEFRLSALALGALALSSFGWKIRKTRAKFSTILQGGGLGILYLDIFAAYRLYDLLPPTLALALLIVTTALLVVLSLAQNEMWLAVMATAGAFLAPILASKGGGSHVALFSYFALVNLGVLTIAYFRSWRWLNVQGFLFTFVLTGLWAGTAYEAKHFASAEPFLILFFAIYFAVGILFARPTKNKKELALDGTIVFGVPIATFALQARLVADIEYGLAYSAAIFAAIYVMAAKFLNKRAPELYRFLTESFIAIGVCFATLAVPFAITNRWTASVWALEGAALIWFGLRLKRALPLWSGVALQLISAVMMLFAFEHKQEGQLDFSTPAFWGGMIFAAAYLISSYLFSSQAPDKVGFIPRRVFGYAFAAVGALELFVRGANAFDELARTMFDSGAMGDSAAAVYFAAAGLFMVLLADRLKWIELGFVRYLAGPWFFLWFIADMWGTHFSLRQPEWIIARFIAINVALYIAYRDRDRAMNGFARFAQLVFPLMTLCGLITTELSQAARQFVSMYGFWQWMPLYIVPALFAALVLSKKPQWPHERHYDFLIKTALPIFLFFAWFTSMNLNFVNNGETRGVPYIPVFSAIDLAQILVLAVILRALLGLHRQRYLSDQIRNYGFSAFGVYTLVWLSSVVVRTVHHQTGTAWNFRTSFENSTVQMSISLLWSVCALALMFVSSRKRWRQPWIAGIVVLAAVVAKLLLIDLASRGTVERIVSFIGTGLILLAAGYLAPLPPSDEKKESV